jgi:hypothetical protein
MTSTQASHKGRLLIPLLVIFGWLASVATADEYDSVTKKNGVVVMKTKTLEIIKSENGKPCHPYKVDIEITIYEKPTFYQGSMPLSFISRKQFLNGGGAITLEHRQANWTNIYGYSNDQFLSGIPTECRTVDKNGRLLAIAKLSSRTEGYGVEIMETHYDEAGKATFECKSKIDTSNQTIGLKNAEAVMHGKKQMDYYFVWPVSTRDGAM